MHEFGDNTARHTAVQQLLIASTEAGRPQLWHITLTHMHRATQDVGIGYLLRDAEGMGDILVGSETSVAVFHGLNSPALPSVKDWFSVCEARAPDDAANPRHTEAPLFIDIVVINQVELVRLHLAEETILALELPGIDPPAPVRHHSDLQHPLQKMHKDLLPALVALLGTDPFDCDVDVDMASAFWACIAQKGLFWRCEVSRDLREERGGDGMQTACCKGMGSVELSDVTLTQFERISMATGGKVILPARFHEQKRKKEPRSGPQKYSTSVLLYNSRCT